MVFFGRHPSQAFAGRAMAVLVAGERRAQPLAKAPAAGLPQLPEAVSMLR